MMAMPGLVDLHNHAIAGGLQRQNLLKIPTRRISQTKVLLTLVGRETVIRARFW